MPEDVSKAMTQSVQNLAEVDKQNGASTVGFWMQTSARGELLPPWGTRARERTLRTHDRNDFNNLWQGAANGLVNKFANTPSQLKGGRNLTARFDDVLRYSQFGAGEKQLKKLIGRDYLRFDGGAYLEIIAPGNPLKPPTGAVTSIAHLDSFHCLPTGDPEFPVVYYNTRPGKKASLNVLHHTRVIHFVDMPDGDQDNPGYGLCALSRAMALVNREIQMGRYIVSSLDDKPQPGIVLVEGMTQQTWQKAWQYFADKQSTDLLPEWGKNLPIFSMDPALPVKLQMFRFSEPPEKFDYKVYVEIDVHELALALGVGIQDIWELTSGNIGSAGQSEIQHAKSSGNTLGDMLTTWELSMNNYVLPESLEYEHKVRDPYEANERASNALTWADFVEKAGSRLTPEEGRQILANQVEAVADAIIDDSGKIIRLDSADPVAEDQQLRIVENSAPNNPEATTGASMQLELVKDFDATRTEFVSAFTDLVNAGLADDISRRRAGTVLRANLNRLGKQARLDGLLQGGVEELSDDDLNAHTVWLAEQSGYVTTFMDEVYSAGLSEAQVATRADAWSNKSLTLAYSEGVQSADANGMYIFEGEDGVESDCATCPRLKGQQHRMKEWAAKELRPGVDTKNFDCGGWECKHRLVKTTGRASGKW